MADRDPEGPRLIPLAEDPKPQGGLTGFNYVSLADIAMKVWENADKKATKSKPDKKKSPANDAK